MRLLIRVVHEPVAIFFERVVAHLASTGYAFGSNGRDAGGWWAVMTRYSEGEPEKWEIEFGAVLTTLAAAEAAFTRIAGGGLHPRCTENHSSPDCQCAELWAADGLRAIQRAKVGA